MLDSIISIFNIKCDAYFAMSGEIMGESIWSHYGGYNIKLKIQAIDSDSITMFNFHYFLIV